MYNKKYIFFVFVILIIISTSLYSENILSESNITGNTGFLFFIGVFFVGLALNLTPCVYPMMTITLSIFCGQDQNGKISVIIKALSYVLGIATMYSVLGVIAALTGSLFGSIMQSGIVLVSIGILFLLLSLSMFGLYELRLPSKFMSKLGARQTAGFIGTYISGLMVGIFAAPCIGPPIIGLLAYVGHKADPVFGFFAFFILSLGLGLPYLLLGVFSGLINKMPKSGMWMIWVKKLLGFILVSVGLFYISLYFYPPLIFHLIPLTFIIGGIYLGFIDRSDKYSKTFILIKKIIGLLLIIGSIIFFITGRIDSFEWKKYNVDEINLLKNKNENVIIYFSADWCIPCIELDRRTFTSQRIMNKMNNWSAYKVDLTNFNSPESEEIRQKYSISGVPTIIFIDSNGNEIRNERIVGFISEDDLFIKLENVKKIIDSKIDLSQIETSFSKSEPSNAFLISDVKWIRPGKSFNIGVLFLMNDDWYTYWKNPGDAGLKADINWNLPNGFTIEDKSWPIPKRYDNPPFASFGHAPKLLLFHKVNVPSDLQIGEKIKFEASVFWLVCKDICLSQDAEIVLELDVRDEPLVNSEWIDIFNHTKNSFPVQDDSWKFSAIADNNQITLKLVPPKNITLEILNKSDFFPSQEGLVKTEKVDWIKSEDSFVLNMLREPPINEVKYFNGVLVLHYLNKAIIVECEL